VYCCSQACSEMMEHEEEDEEEEAGWGYASEAEALVFLLETAP
jgi:hypothetical protein